ncbi:Fatty acid synthase subunit alpha [Hyphodiscus hymeniophilus]|uniref:Fatty acid synthase subunit alpha n=1 Tax=Hyphodiscus hymeniophilus TaxID=353542 RepID=A0A9P6SQE3_9HELO|nr:Fatty acid synthase subunit alpha [Hyphodiscus hymeniophilus]
MVLDLSVPLDTLFSKENGISRFVELGPSNILANMAKRTGDSKYRSQDAVLCLQRLFLACTRDLKEIHYQYDDPEVGLAEVEEEEPLPAKKMEQVLPRIIAPAAVTIAATSVADVPTPALHIVRALVAYKLRKPIQQVPPEKSIKDLSGGKSTLQNELIGDVTNEFGSTPDGAEDKSLARLSEELQPHSSGQLGKTSSALIARFISAMMPAKFNLNAIRDHLHETWLLGPSRQASVILFAMTQGVASGSGRLASITAAKEMLDTAVATYAASSGLTLQKASQGTSVQEHTLSSMDPSALAKLSSDQRLLAKMQHQTLANYLGIENSNLANLTEFEQMQQDLQSRLDVWSSEFGTEVELGIKPKFNPKHLRHFNFAWNQARMEIYKLYSEALSQSELLHNMADRRLQQIANKSPLQAVTLVRSLLYHTSGGNRPQQQFDVIGERLIELIFSSQNQLPKATFPISMTRPVRDIGEDGSIKCVEVPRFDNKDPEAYISLLKSGKSQPYTNLISRRQGRWAFDAELTQSFFEALSLALKKGMSFSNKVVLITGAGQGSIGAELVRRLLMGGATVIVTTSRPISEAQKFFRHIYSVFGARGSELFVLPFNQGSAQDCKDLINNIYSDSGLGRNIDVIVPFAAISEKGIEVDGIGSKSELAHRLMLVNVLRLIGCIIQTKNERKIECRPTQVLLPFSPNHGTFGGDGLYAESKLGLESLVNRFSSESWRDQVTVCGAVIGWTRGTALMDSNDALAETIESHGALTFLQDEMALLLLVLLTPPITRIYESEAIIADFSGGLQSFSGLDEIMSKARLQNTLDAEIKKAIHDEDALERAAIIGSALPKKKGISLPQPVPKTRSSLSLEFPNLPNYHNDLHSLKHLNGMVDLTSTVVIVGFSELGPWGNARTRWQMESKHQLTQTGYIEMAWMMGLIKHFDGEKSDAYFAGWVDAKTGETLEDDQIPPRFSEHIFRHAGIRLIEPDLIPGYDPEKKEYLQEIAIEEDLPEFETTRLNAEALKLKHGNHVSIRQMDDSDMFRVQLKANAHIMVAKTVPFSYSLVAGLIPSGWDAAIYGISEDLIRQVDSVTLFTLCCVAEAFYSAGIEDSTELFKYLHLSDVGNFIGTGVGGSSKSKELYRDTHHDKQVQGDLLQETFLNTPAAWVNMLLLGGTGPIKTPVGACATGLESIDNGVDSILTGKTKMCLVGGTDHFEPDISYGFSTMKATVDSTEQFSQGREPAEFSRPTAATRAGFLESHGCGIQIICSADVALKMGLPIYAIVAGSTMAADKIGRSIPAPGKGILTFARESPDATKSPLLSLDYRREQMQKGLDHLLNGSREKGAELYSRSPTDKFPDTPLSIYSLDQDSSDTDSGYFKNRVDIHKKSPKHQIINSISSYLLPEATITARINAVRRQWGNGFREQQPTISPLRASLAVFGLTIDDIGVASLHGTSTKANDTNETDVIHTQMMHLGRKGAPLLAICQKSITGHPKAPAAAWMLNGCLQVLNTGLVPGNSNCDNIDPVLEKFSHVLFPTESIQVPEVKAFMVSSFGFGQKGGQMVGIAPKYLFATLDKADFDIYADQVTRRKTLANRAFAKAVMSNSVFKAHTHPPYTKDDESRLYLDPLARTIWDPKTGAYRFDPARVDGPATGIGRQQAPHTDAHPSTTALVESSLHALVHSTLSTTSIISIGTDVESLISFGSDANPTFLERNYTDAERKYALLSRDPHATFVGRWCAKEAVFKCLQAKGGGAGAPLKDIEIWRDDNGAPRVRVSRSFTLPCVFRLFHVTDWWYWDS